MTHKAEGRECQSETKKKHTVGRGNTDTQREGAQNQAHTKNKKKRSKRNKKKQHRRQFTGKLVYDTTMTTSPKIGALTKD